MEKKLNLLGKFINDAMKKNIKSISCKGNKKQINKPKKRMRECK